MVTAEDIRHLPRGDKLRLMELIWSDLIASGETIDSPGWHQVELSQTEERVAAGIEAPVDWTLAKEMLRSER